MNVQGYQNYKQSSLNSMTPGELLCTLYDELVKRCTLAKISLEKKDYPTFESAVERCEDIVQYLDDTLDRDYEISRSLARMHEYFSYSLGRVKIGRNEKLLGELHKMFSELRDTFRAADNKNMMEAKNPPAPAPVETESQAI